MERIPEPDLMDDAEQAKAYAEADFSEPHDAFVRHFKSRFPYFSEGKVLDLGCGTADVVIRFARAYPGVNISGIEGAEAMLDIGIREVSQKGLAQRIEFHKCVLPSAELLQVQYDAVISNSLLHHLINPFILWKTVRRCAKPEAPIFIMDLLRPDTVESAKGLLQRYAADASPVLQKDFFNSLLAAYNDEEIRQQLKKSNLHYLDIEIVSDRHVLIWGKSREK
jgi:ubiquinone/menaquinone biosynthesis C-methylase UbiE